MNDPTIEHYDDDHLTVTYRPTEHGDNIHAYLGAQLRPCVYALGPSLLDALFPLGIAGAELYNLCEEYEGCDDTFIGWTFRVRFWQDA